MRTHIYHPVLNPKHHLKIGNFLQCQNKTGHFNGDNYRRLVSLQPEASHRNPIEKVVVSFSHFSLDALKTTVILKLCWPLLRRTVII